MSPIIQEPGKGTEMEVTAKVATHKVNTHTHTHKIGQPEASEKPTWFVTELKQLISFPQNSVAWPRTGLLWKEWFQNPLSPNTIIINSLIIAALL